MVLYLYIATHSNFSLDVIFVEGTGIGPEGIWINIMVNMTAKLNCTVSANPYNVTVIDHSNSTMMDDNVKFKVLTFGAVHMGMFTITKPHLSNRGHYNCATSNGIQSANLSYNAFIGGMNKIIK